MAQHDRVLTSAREMLALLKRLNVKGKIRGEIDEVVERADQNIPARARGESQVRFLPGTVRNVVDQCGGDKQAAAQKLGCSLRTVYTALGRKEG